MDITRIYSSKNGKPVSCTIAEPIEETIDGKKGWYVGITFEGVDDITEPLHIGGEDALQALELALNLVSLIQLANGLQWPAQAQPAPAASTCDC